MKKITIILLLFFLFIIYITLPASASVMLDVPYISQLPKYPNGCEPVSMTMALRYAGLHISDGVFIDYCLDTAPTVMNGRYGGDPEEYYIGNPRNGSGWGCSVEVIEKAAKKLTAGTGYRLSARRGLDTETLCRTYLDRGIPVVIWGTVNMGNYYYPACYAHWTTPDGKEISYNYNQHCVVLIGYDEENYYVNDPLRGRAVAYPKERLETAYNLMGRQSIAVYDGSITTLPRTGISKIRILTFEQAADGFARALAK